LDAPSLRAIEQVLSEVGEHRELGDEAKRGEIRQTHLVLVVARGDLDVRTREDGACAPSVVVSPIRGTEFPMYCYPPNLLLKEFLKTK
jgi:hypothetical protein